MLPEPINRLSAQDKKFKNSKRHASLCPKLEKKLMKNSIFNVPAERMKGIDKLRIHVNEKREELAKFKVSTTLQKVVGSALLKTLLKMARE